MENEYLKQAEKFLKETNTKMKIEFLKWDFHFEDDKEKRDIYKIALIRGDRIFIFNFGNSIVHSGEYILFPSRERIHLNKSYKGIPIKNIKGFGLLNNGNSKKNNDFKVPDTYDILACLTKSEVNSFEDFCSDYGYDNNSIKAEKIYHAVLNEWNNLKMLYSDEELSKLAEIN